MSEREPTAGDDQLPAGGAATTGPRDIPSSTGDPAAGPSSDSASHAPKYCPQCGNEYDPGLSFCPKDGNVLQVRHGENSLVGQILGRHYRILELLGEGGMGQVFLAEHVRIGRRCAIKVMRPALVRDPGAVGRFGREAMTAGRINHRNAVAVYDFGETDDGLIYIVMEHVEGEALSRLLTREGALPPLTAVRITVQITDALVAAHRLGIIHRDLKPDNILVGHDDDGGDLVKVVDFGIAKAVNDDSQTALTKTGFVLGTLQYMSPEQLIGETLDGRSDIYSLGCILFEMLTGERTFAGPSGPAVVVRRLTEPAPTARSRNPSVPEALDAVVAKALARTAAERYQTAEEFRAALLLSLGLDSAAATAMRGAATIPLTVQPRSAPAGSGEQAAVATGSPSAGTPARSPGPSTSDSAEAGAAAGPPPVARAGTGAASPPATSPPEPAGEAAPEKLESGETSRARPAGATSPGVSPPAAARPDPRTGAIHSASTPVQSGPGSQVAAAASESTSAFTASPPESSADTAGRLLTPASEKAEIAPSVATDRHVGRTVVLATVGVAVVAGAFAVVHGMRRPAASPAPAASSPASGVGAPAAAPAPGQVSAGTGSGPGTAASTDAGANGMAKPASTPVAPAVTAAPAHTPEPAAAARLGTMRVAGTLPAGAVVLLDGRPVAGSTFTAPVGRHTVSVVASGFEALSWTGMLAAGQTHVWRVSMRRVQNTAVASAAAGPPSAATGAANAAPVAAPPVASPPAAQPAPATTQPTAPAAVNPPSENGEAVRAAASIQARRAAEGMAAAITARDMPALRRAWPGIPPEPARRWREFLLSPDNRDIVAKVVVTRPAAVDGSSASAQFSVAVDFNNRLSGRATAVSRFTASLARQGSDWTVTDIRPGW